MDRLLSLGGPLGQMGVLTEVPDAWHPAIRKLLESGLSHSVLTQLSRKLKDIPHPGKELEWKVLSEVLSGFLEARPPISKPESGQRVIALVGPTGVGKTTTLAKLASGLVVDSQTPTRVGLITVDTYRLAAVVALGQIGDTKGLSALEGLEANPSAGLVPPPTDDQRDALADAVGKALASLRGVQ